MIFKTFLLFFVCVITVYKADAKVPREFKYNLIPLLKSADGEDIDQFTTKYLEQMNQYFEYKFNDKNQLMINDKLSIVHEIQFLKLTDDTVGIDFKNIQTEGLDVTVYGKKSTNSEKIHVFKLLEKKNNQSVYEFSTDYPEICIALKNRFTSLNICRNQKLIFDDTDRAESEFNVSVNDLVAEKAGVVLLQNFEKEIHFSVKYDQLEQIDYAVIKRLPLIRKISKNAQSENVKLDLFDYRIENSEWSDDVVLNQNYIELKLNSILSVRQEIAFSNRINKTTSLNDQFTSSEKSSAITLEPSTSARSRHRRLALGVGSALYSRTDQVFDMSLVVKNALSVQFIYQQFLGPQNSIDYSLDYTQFKIVDNAENVPVEGANGVSYFLKTSYRWLLSDHLHVSAGLGLFSTSFYKSSTNLSSITSSTGQLISVPLKVLIRFKIRETTEFNIPMEYGYLMGGDQISSGSVLSYGGEVLEDFNGTVYLFGLKSISKNQKYFEYDQKEDHFQTYFGLLF